MVVKLESEKMQIKSLKPNSYINIKNVTIIKTLIKNRNS